MIALKLIGGYLALGLALLLATWLWPKLVAALRKKNVAAKVGALWAQIELSHAALLFLVWLAFAKITHLAPADRLALLLSFAVLAVLLWRREQRRVWPLVAGVLVFGLGLRLLYFNGVYGHVDWVYLFHGRQAYNNDYHEIFNSQWGMRYYVLFPIIAAYKLFGPSYATAFAPTLFNSIVEIALAGAVVYFIVKSRTAVLLAMWLAAIFPLSVFTGSTLTGDAESAALAGIAVLMLALIARNVDDKPVRLHLPLLLGFVVAAGMWAKPNNIVVGLGAGAALLWLWAGHVLRFRHLLLFAMGASIWLGADTGIQLAAGQSPLHRFHRTLQVFQEQQDNDELANDASLEPTYGPALFFDVPQWNREIRRWHPNNYVSFGAWGFLVLLAMIALWRHERARIGWLLLLLGVGLLYLLFGSMSVASYLPLHKEPRYFMVLSTAMIAVASLFLAHEYDAQKASRLLVMVLLAGLAASSLANVSYNHAQYKTKTAPLPQVLAEIEARPHTDFFSDHYVVQTYELQSGFARRDPIHRFPGNKPELGALQDIAFFTGAYQENTELILSDPVDDYQARFPLVDGAVRRGMLVQDKCFGDEKRRFCFYRLQPGEDKTEQIAEFLPRPTLWSAEAEHLPFTAEKTEAYPQETAVFTTGRWSGNQQLFVDAWNGEGALLLQFTLPQKYRGELFVVYTLAADYGIARFALDDMLLGEPTDAFSPEVHPSPWVSLGSVDLAAGLHVLRVTASEKNESSYGYKIGLDRLALIGEPAQ